MLEDPGLDLDGLAEALRTRWGIGASAFAFVPGYDMAAVSYAVTAGDAPVFLKVYLGAPPATALEVTNALVEAGIPNVLAPLPTLDGDLWLALADGPTAVVHPFVEGRSAMEAGMDANDWRAFGSTLRAVHDSDIGERFAGRLPLEAFDLPCATAVRDALAMAGRPAPDRSRAQERLADLLMEHRGEIGTLVGRASELGRGLTARPFENVLCHADIHAANILVTADGGIRLVDWDAPRMAPRERDLLFVIGSRIARAVEPHEERWFFEAYGDVAIDPEAIVYFRLERILEDIGEIGRSVFEGNESEASRAEEVDLAETFFEPGGIIETAEVVERA